MVISVDNFTSSADHKSVAYYLHRHCLKTHEEQLKNLPVQVKWLVVFRITRFPQLMVGVTMVLALNSVIGGSSLEREQILSQPMMLRVDGLMTVSQSVENATVT